MKTYEWIFSWTTSLASWEVPDLTIWTALSTRRYSVERNVWPEKIFGKARSYLQSLPYKPKIPWSKLYPNADPKVGNSSKSGSPTHLRKIGSGKSFLLQAKSCIRLLTFLRRCWPSTPTRGLLSRTLLLIPTWNRWTIMENYFWQFLLIVLYYDPVSNFFR